MRAVLISEAGSPAKVVDLEEEHILDGEVELDVLYSSYNYKDGMAIAGKGNIVRSWPLIPGIDVVGRVTSSAAPGWEAGDLVTLNGDGLGESRHGGFATRARVRADSLIKLPDSLTPAHAAAIGTAGFTAMIAVLRLEDAGITPQSGDILVTGASGGVGSVATSLLAARGYRVTASSGRGNEQSEYLTSLGAAAVIDRNALAEPGKPLQTQRWAGAIDSVGSTPLANILAQTAYDGTVVTCGLAAGADLPTTVLPFILRGVTLTGANSVDAPLTLRKRAWAALDREIDRSLLESMSTTISLEETIPYADRILAGQVRGRTIVDVNR